MDLSVVEESPEDLRSIRQQRPVWAQCSEEWSLFGWNAANWIIAAKEGRVCLELLSLHAYYMYVRGDAHPVVPM